MLVQLADISFGYAGEELFEGLTWQVNPGEHIGLVGPNGAGKSTLLRLMAGELEPEKGQVARRRGTSVGYLHQSQEFHGAGSILSALMAPFADVLAIHDEMAAIAVRFEADHAAADLERYGHLEEQLRMIQLSFYASLSAAPTSLRCPSEEPRAQGRNDAPRRPSSSSRTMVTLRRSASASRR